MLMAQIVDCTIAVETDSSQPGIQLNNEERGLASVQLLLLF